MRFHLIDRIDSWEAGKAVVARKLTSVVETYWDGDHPDRMTMPPGLVLESLLQAATWLLMLGSDFRRRATLLSVDEVVHAGPVVPGDILRIEVSIISLGDEAAVIEGVVLVEHRPVLIASGIMCGLLDADTMDDPAATERMARALTRRELVR